MAGVLVTLSGVPGVALRTLTDSKGRFVFRGLPASEGYRIGATKPGYAGGGLSQVLLASQYGSRIPLDEGEWISNADFVMWRLGGISGTVVDERREPVVGVPVRVLLRIPVAGVTQLASGSVARTDDRGMYRIAGLRGGSYIVTVPSVQAAAPLSTPTTSLISAWDGPVSSSLPNLPWVTIGETRLLIGRYSIPPPISTDRAPRAYPIVFYPNVRSISEASPVLLADGEEKRAIDFTLEPVPTARISGRLEGPPDRISGMVLRLLPDENEALGMGSEQATAIAGLDGMFTFAGVPAGRYTIEAGDTVSGIRSTGWLLTGGVPGTPGIMTRHSIGRTIASTFGQAVLETVYTTPGADYSSRLRVTVGSADVSGIVVPLQRLATISGRVLRDDGAPLSGPVRVSVEPANGSADLGGPAPVDSDLTGRFAIGGLKRGEYWLHVDSGGFLKSIAAPGGDHTERAFEAVPGTDIDNVVVTVTSKAATLTGQVLDRQGAVVSEAAVVVFPTDPSHWVKFGLEPPRIRSVTYFGRRGYQITRLLRGEYYAIAVRADLHDAWQMPGFLAAAAPQATRMALDWGEARALNLTLREVAIK